MKSMALGRGLDALFGETADAYENEGTQQDKVLELSVKDIKPNPFQPRKTFDETALQELSDSIKEDGLLQPIVVNEDFDGYVLIAGERRLRASKLAKLKTIRCVVVKSDDERMRKFALIENIQREELNAVELAVAYEELIKLHNITQEQLATMIHKSRSNITNTLRLLQLSVKTQQALLEKKITAGHAKVLVGLDDKQQQVMVNSIVGQKLSVRDVEAMIKAKKMLEAPVEEKHYKATYNFSNLHKNFDSLGLKAKSSGNKLTIEFDNESQIDDFLNKFTNFSSL
ncbi:MAG: ParB family chromosome partitioning protein [Sulfurimonas sp.]|jgi:ParB family chromosome partitioning protein|uniref:ParB/RepB/Spo0J family partition protein n=1 Tax=Sulfurimonas sp. TaxID=2022749 RepID=UPI0039E4E4E0